MEMVKVEGVVPDVMAREGCPIESSEDNDPGITRTKSGDCLDQKQKKKEKKKKEEKKKKGDVFIAPTVVPTTIVREDGDCLDQKQKKKEKKKKEEKRKKGDVFLAPTVVPTTIVREDLSEGNYANWRACMRQYLVGQGLWEVCLMKCKAPDKKDPVAYSLWKRKNAMALHAIQISCSQTKLSQIRGIKHAKRAWDFLKRNADPTLYFDKIVHENADLSQYQKLRDAVEHGSWNDIENFFRSKPDAMRAKISKSGLTPLHGAALFGQLKVVEKLVAVLNEEDLELKDRFGLTPLALAASDGNRYITEIAEAMIKKNSRLANISDADNILPVVHSCIEGKRETTRFLYSNTAPELLAPEEGKGRNGATLLSSCIASKFLDIALDIVQKYPRLGVTLDMDGLVPLYVLGQRPSLFKNGSQLWFFHRWIYSCITADVDPASHPVQINIVDDTAESQDETNNTKKVLLQFLHWLVSNPLELLDPGIKNIYVQKLMHAQTTVLLQRICNEMENINLDRINMYRVHQAVIQAVKKGNVEFVTKMVKTIPELVWRRDVNGRNLFSITIMNRQEKIFNLLYGLTNGNTMRLMYGIDRFRNNMLHLAAMLPPLDQLDNISGGAALQMQRELQWFKEVENIMPATHKDLKNSDGKKPNEVFSEQHASMVKEGEKWMKEIATSSSFVAALIVTIMFAAAFTIPGGNNDEGAPIFLHDNLYMVFIISDSISLFSATTSVLMFLGILTSPYAENKFLMRLPTKLIIGLSTLFISIVAMMIAFSAALAILLKESSTKVIMIPIALLASIPVTLFAVMQFPLLVDIFISTYGPSIFNRKI